MKLTQVSRLVVPALALLAPALAAASPVLVSATVRDVFVPVGFDDNDEVTAVIDGWLPDSCYKLAHVESTYDAATRTFHITQYAWHHGGFTCLQIITPFTVEARLGVQEAGKYTVEATGAKPQPLEVKKANNLGPDDYTYAPIDDAIVQVDDATGRYVATIQGRFTNTCMEWDEVRVIDSGRVIEVLPIVDVGGGTNCKETDVRFTRKVELPADISAGRHLLHVRSLNGKAINTVFTVYVK